MTNVSALSTPAKFQQPWLLSPVRDGLLIISPALVSSALALIFSKQYANVETLPTWAWVSFVLFVDVAHVYATLWRTYFNEKAWKQHGFVLVAIPIACWVAGSVLYSIDALIFWRTLAYVAVFHFIRQQYGFMVLYSRRDPEGFRQFRWLDCLCIYAVTVYPLLFWHAHLPRNFVWFIDGDFVEISSHIASAGFIIYILTVALYALKEAALWLRTNFINIPKNLIVIGTAVSWWVGIVATNSDIAFTVTNVVSHGIPYMALVWFYHHDDERSSEPAPAKRAWNLNRLLKLGISFAPVFILLLWLFAYLEEGLWDGFVWHEHTLLFSPFTWLPPINDGSILALLIPLLALPQSTHYVLDGFIWRVKDRTSIWSA